MDAGERVFLVTGASGFVGKALCRQLSSRGRVRALVRRSVAGPWHETVRADLARDLVPPASLRGVDVVFHLAGRAHAEDDGPDAEALHRAVTVDGTRRLLDACAVAGVSHVVFMSSVKAMGEGSATALAESAELAPASAYGRAKRAAEDLVLGVEHGVALRLPLVYGPGQKGNLARMIEAVAAGRFPPPPRVANRRSMVHVEDAARAAMLAAEEPAARGRAFIVSDGYGYSTREIYEWICEALGVATPRWTVPDAGLRALARVGDVVRRVRGRRWRFDSDAYGKLFGSAYYDTSAARDVLGFVPEWDLRRALPSIVKPAQAERAGAAVP